MKRSPLEKFFVALTALFMAAGADSPGLCAQSPPPSHEALSFEEPISWPEPRVETFTLKNGIRFFLIQDNELPLIQVKVTVRSGKFLDPADKAGLAEITGNVMRSGGTKQYPPQKLNRLLADHAAEIETSFDFISGSAGMSLLSKDFKDLLPVFVDLLRRPAFPEDKIALAKQQLDTRIARRNNEQSSIARRTYKRLLYGRGSVYAQKPQYETVENIDRADLVRFHRRAYQGANLMVGMTGDFDPDTVRPLLEKAFSVFPAGKKMEMSLPPVKGRQETSLHVVKKSDVNQSYLLTGHLGGWRQNPDYAALQVMNQILSGGFAGRLFETIRTEMGLAYAVFGRYGANYYYPGMFFVGVETRTSATAEAIRAVENLLVGLQQHIEPGELALAKDQFLNSLVFQYDQPEEILARRMHYAYRGMDEDSFQKLVENIRRVTADDVLRVAEEYIRPDALTILAVGEKEKLVQQMKNIGPVEVLPLP